MSEPPKYTLFHQDEHLEAFYLNAPSNMLLVTFSPAGERTDGARVWGAPVRKHLKCAGLCFMSRRPNWFPPASIDAALAALGDWRERHRQVVSFGFSHGAYGALKHARRVGVRLAVAMAPQNPTLRAALPGSLEAETPDAFDGLDLTPDDLPRSCVILFDPLQRVDTLTVRSILPQATDDRRIVPTWASGHANVTVVARANLLGAMVELCVRGDWPALHALLARARRHWAERPLTVATYACRHHPAIAADIHRLHGGGFPPQQAMLLQQALSKSWTRAGDPAAAAAAARLAATLAGGDARTGAHRPDTGDAIAAALAGQPCP